MLRHWIAAAGAVALAGTAAPAMADDSFFGRTNCADSSQPGCEVVVESQETTPGSPGIVGDSGNRGTGSAAAEPDCETDRVSARCTVTVSTGGSGGEEGVDFAAFAYAARAAFQLPAPGIAMSPSADTPILVQVPVWLWIAPPEWEPQEATATVPGGSVTVTATPAAVVWSMGDGTTLTCEGPGTVYDPARHDAADASPDCGHTYTSAGSDRQVEASVSWRVEWSSSDGDGGVLDDLVTTSTTTVQVTESSGVVT